MKQKEFEKEVMEKMDAFNMQPSDEVWVEVERRIRKEKKRRFIFWWPVCALLLAGGAGIHFLSQKNRKDDNKKEVVNGKNRNNQYNKEKNSLSNEVDKAEHKKEEKSSVAMDEIQAETNVKKESNNIISIKSLADKKVRSVVIMEQKIHHQPAMASIKESKKDWDPLPETRVVNAGKDLPITDMPEKRNQAVENNPIATISTNIPKLVKTDTVATFNNDTVVAAAIVSATKKDTVPVIDTVVTIKQNKKENPWQWGAALFTGSSSLADGFTVLNKSFSFDALANNTPPTASLSSRNSSSVRKGASFKAEVFVQRPVAKRLNLKIGTGYTYLSWSLKVGIRVDSLINPGAISGGSGPINTLPVNFVSGFYRTGSSSIAKRYTNNYHQLGLSAELSWKIIQGKKINISWDNGFTYSKLLGSSMLHYSNVISGYYKDNSLLTKNHFLYSTGLSLNWGGRFYIGPAINYSLTPVLKNSTGVKTHFSSIGINARFLFQKQVQRKP